MKLHRIDEAGSDATHVDANATLLLPAVTIGTVGQLAVDLLIATLKAQLVGYLEDPDVLPVVGADPYAPPTATQLHMAASLEVYHASPHNLYIIQQRAPAAPGRQHAFATSMVSWIDSQHFEKVVLLGSVPAALRRDADLMEDSVRALALDAAQQAVATQYGCMPLEESVYASEMPSVQPWPLVAAARSAHLPLLALLVFAAEGDNVPDAIRLVQQAASVLGVFDSGSQSNGVMATEELGAALGGRWAVPPSWQHLFGKSVDVTLR